MANWADDIETALENLGGEAHLSGIYGEVEEIRKAAGRTWPPTARDLIRGTPEKHCRDSDIFGGDERFTMLARGSGQYRLISTQREYSRA